MSHARPVRTSVNNLISVVFYSHYTFYVATPTERLPSGRQTIKNATRIIQPVVESTLCFNCSLFTAFTVRSATLHCLPFSVLCVCVCVRDAKPYKHKPHPFSLCTRVFCCSFFFRLPPSPPSLSLSVCRWSVFSAMCGLRFCAEFIC